MGINSLELSHQSGHLSPLSRHCMLNLLFERDSGLISFRITGPCTTTSSLGRCRPIGLQCQACIPCQLLLFPSLSGCVWRPTSPLSQVASGKSVFGDTPRGMVKLESPDRDVKPCFDFILMFTANSNSLQGSFVEQP